MQRKVLERKGMMQHEPPRISDSAVANLYVCMYGICVVQCGAAGGLEQTGDSSHWCVCGTGDCSPSQLAGTGWGLEPTVCVLTVRLATQSNDTK